MVGSAGSSKSRKSSKEISWRPAEVEAESGGRVRGEGIWAGGDDGLRPRAMISKRPPGQTNPAIFSMARGRRLVGRTWSVLASNTKSKLPRHAEGGASKLATQYSTEVAGKRLRDAWMAVSEMSKAVVRNPQAASCSASSPRPHPVGSAAFPVVVRGCVFQNSSKKVLGQSLAHGTVLFPASPSW